MARVTDPAIKATPKPMEIPKPASAAMRASNAHSSLKPSLRETGVEGQAAARATVIARDSTIRSVEEECRSCGRGTNTNVAATLVRTSRNPYKVAVERGSSVPMPLAREARQVSENRSRECHHLHEHPGQQQKDSHQERYQPRRRAERRVLNRSHDLNKADDDTGDQADPEQRRAQPEGGDESL